LATILLIYGLGKTRLSKFSLIFALVLSSGLAILLNLFFNADIKLVKDIAEVPRSLPSLFFPDLKLISTLIIPAIAIGIIGLVQGAGVSQTFPNPDGKFSDVSRIFWSGSCQPGSWILWWRPSRWIQLGYSTQGKRRSPFPLGNSCLNSTSACSDSLGELVRR
jgi:hypothetical protein